MFPPTISAFCCARCTAKHTAKTLHKIVRIHRLLFCVMNFMCRFQWPRGLRRRSAAARGFESHLVHGCLSVVSVVRSRSLRRADHSSRGVPPAVVRRCFWSRNLVNEEALAYWGVVAPKNKQTNWISCSPIAHQILLKLPAHPLTPPHCRGHNTARHCFSTSGKRTIGGT